MRNTTFLNKLHVRSSVRIIEVSDNRGTDNRGRAVHVMDCVTNYGVEMLSKRSPRLYLVFGADLALVYVIGVVVPVALHHEIQDNNNIIWVPNLKGYLPQGGMSCTTDLYR